MARDYGKQRTNSAGHYVSTERELTATVVYVSRNGSYHTMPVSLKNWKGSVASRLEEHAEYMRDVVGVRHVHHYEEIEIWLTRYATPFANRGTHVRRTRSYYISKHSL